MPEDKSYPELDEFSTLDGSELVAVHQEGRLVRIPLADLAQWIKTAESIVPASEPFEGVLLRRTSDLAAVTWPVVVPWQEAEYDTDSFWSAGAPTRITIPAGVSKVRLFGQIAATAFAQAGSLHGLINKNGSSFEFSGEVSVRSGATGFGTNNVAVSTPVVPVEAGDYFELRANRANLASMTDVIVTRTFFGLEVVEKAP